MKHECLHRGREHHTAGVTLILRATTNEPMIQSWWLVMCISYKLKLIKLADKFTVSKSSIFGHIIRATTQDNTQLINSDRLLVASLSRGIRPNIGRISLKCRSNIRKMHPERDAYLHWCPVQRPNTFWRDFFCQKHDWKVVLRVAIPHSWSCPVFPVLIGNLFSLLSASFCVPVFFSSRLSPASLLSALPLMVRSYVHLCRCVNRPCLPFVPQFSMMPWCRSVLAIVLSFLCHFQAYSLMFCLVFYFSHSGFLL